MKYLLGTILIGTIFLACDHNKTSVGPEPVNNDNPFIGCWLLIERQTYSDTGWIFNNENDVFEDTLFFTDTTYIHTGRGYFLNPFTGEYQWGEVGTSWGDYSYDIDSIFLQTQSDLAHPVPHEYSIVVDTLKIDQSSVLPGTIKYLMLKSDCVL